MTPIKWIILGLFCLGFIWAWAWVLALGLFEFGVRRGNTITALWAEGLIHRSWGSKGGGVGKE